MFENVIDGVAVKDTTSNADGDDSMSNFLKYGEIF